MQAMIIAFAMYSKIPMPRVAWDEKNMQYAFCWFPAIGIVIGIAEYGLFWLLNRLGVGDFLKGVFLAAVPLLVTGGIHLDGFMDTTDALSSYGDRDKKLMILKDSHVGAFAVIGCCVYLMLSAGLWSEISETGMKLMMIGFVFERTLSGLAAVNFKGARKKGMLASFAEPAKRKVVSGVLIAAAVVCGMAMTVLWLPGAIVCVVLALICWLYYYKMSMKQFGGITGDLAGWFLQVCELVMLAGAVCVGYLL